MLPANFIVTIPGEEVPLIYHRPPFPKRSSWTMKGLVGIIATISLVVIVRLNTQFNSTPFVPQTTDFTPLPSNIYGLPLNESCKVEYLDPSPKNLCWKVEGLCRDNYNCPRLVMCQFNPHATLLGFAFWFKNNTNVTYEYISAGEVLLCQREVFADKVEFDKKKQKHPIPGEQLPCEKEGRIYPISSEGCAIDGNHGVTACKELGLFVKIIRFTTPFFSLVEAAKNYTDLCWNRLLSADICHLTI